MKNFRKVRAVGDRLGLTVEAYNKSTGSLENRVLLSARKLRDLKVSADEVEKIPRMLQPEEFVTKLQEEEA